MPGNTTNFNLIKPDQDEFYNVCDQNNNMDTIDRILKTLQDAINSGATEQELATLRQDLATHLADEEKHLKTGERTSWNGKYAKPGTGIPKTDLASSVQTSLDKADSAVQNSEKGAANGVATLDASKKILLAQVPDLASLGVGKSAEGSYVGDGIKGKKINIGFTPKFVMITAGRTGNIYTYYSGIMAGFEKGFTYFGGTNPTASTVANFGTVGGITQDGFILNSTSDYGLNCSETVYYWSAFS
ncbi:hypothetical protein [Bacillus sp. S/N-304-OC-R1]|uniref:hypothetical protein n=1 Tax=Bacillus sp. S/N-304-OC-R1 TaxID=2758034 RepID=UPI001C8DC895|nr:hypothetical protein [Bacillus sp. S/N-304-OC-R1]MBY0122143.1 hypothetical protein [Bacillus sp. S/N-304-OC-R1]